MIRVGTIGTSGISGRFINATSYVKGIEVVASYSRDPGRGADFARAHGVPVSHSDLGEMLTSEAVDAVYIGSPNSVHKDQAVQALRAGKHVFVEKPATPTADEFATLLKHAQDRGLVLFEGMRNVYDPGFAAIREILPSLGSIRLVSFSYCKRSARYDQLLVGQRVNIFDPALAGGALLDLGVYCLAAIVELFGEPDHVAAINLRLANGVDGGGTALLGYRGFVAQATFSKITLSDLANEIQGESGTLVIDRIAKPRRLTVTDLKGSKRSVMIDGSANSLIYEIARFVDLTSGRSASDTDNARTLATLRLIDAIRITSHST